MFYNSKATAVILTPTLLSEGQNSGKITRLKRKTNGYVTFRADGNKGRFWGRIATDTDLYSKLLTKAQVATLPDPLPAGVCLRDKQCGAVIRKEIVGERKIVSALLS